MSVIGGHEGPDRAFVNRGAGRLAVALLACALVCGAAAAQTTFFVDDDNCPGPGTGTTGDPYCSIQVAIDAASPITGDQVRVRCGTYQENLDLVDGVDVIGSGAGCTVIDGGASGSVVSAVDVGSATVFEGFTLRNGSAARGGGLFLEQSSLTVRKNRIESNTATESGGGIHVTTALRRGSPNPVITQNVIRENTAGQFGGGIELYLAYDAVITDNLIERNTASTAGGGIDIFTSFPDVVNNTIVFNCLQAGGAACSSGGGGIALTSSQVVEIANNVVAWNEAAAGGGGVDDTGGSVVNFTANDVFGNIPTGFSGIADPTGSNGNIAADPAFVNQSPTAGGFQPRSDSPLVDAGNAALASVEDLRGIPRPLDGNADGGAQPDIGARENEGATRLTFASPSDMNWDGSADTAATFNLYRGDLEVLRSTGEYLQPGTVAAARTWCDLMTGSVSDTDPVDAGQTLFYLAVVENAVEGTLGFDSGPSERPFTDANSCPSP
jgi:predicted outer membrane repeat protein